MPAKRKKIEKKKSMLIRKNDWVEAISGKEKGKRGKVLRTLQSQNRVIVEKLNFIKLHNKPKGRKQQSGIIEKEGSIEVSNLMLVCTKCDKPVRVGIQILSDQKKVRICRKCGEVIGKT